MSGTAADVPTSLRVLVVAPQPLGDAIAEELVTGVGDLADVDVVAGPDAAVRAVTTDPDRAVPVVVIANGVGAVDVTIERLDRSPALGAACTLLVTDQARHDDVGGAVDRDRLDGVVAVPWTAGTLAWHARSQLVRWLRAHRPEHPRSRDAADAHRRSLLPSSELLRDLEVEPVEVTRRLVSAIERVLGPRPRLTLPPDTRLTQQDHSVDAVLVVLDGSVALERHTSVGELRFHHGSTGPVIGLLSLAQRRRAYFTARTTTAVEVVHLSVEQLDRALRAEPEVGAALAAVAIRALAQRLRRSEQLQIEHRELNRELEQERRRLGDALHQLEQARLELVEQARFVTLGELAAGVAHELNNPTAVLRRSASYVVEDLERVMDGHPHGELARETMAAARDRAPRSTAEERASKRRLEAAIDDRTLAHRLHAAGIDDPDRARRLAAGDRGVLELVEAAAGIGGAVRNLELAADRVGDLVSSLRAYARPDREPVDDIDLHAGLEDTLRLTAHHLRGIEVERRYGQLPPIRGHPGQLDQVWTNLLVNAAEELDGTGTIEITTDRPDVAHVRVRVVDDGPGIDPDVLPHVFEPRFTTKQGTIRYGLGLGLAIARRLVEQHAGRIDLESRPGRTVATVVLPITGPPPEPPT